jgi:hypothetical protein
MLGGRRETVTVAARRLQDARVIHYVRGHIRIVDRKRLEAATCECYEALRQETDRLLDPARPDFLSSLARVAASPEKP